MPIINKILLNLLSNRLGRSADKLELDPKIAAVGHPLSQLTSEEINKIKETWLPLEPSSLTLDYWKFYKTMMEEALNPLIVPDNIYWSRIIRTLNPVSFTRTYINKSLYPIIFNGLNLPSTILNVINGVPYDGQMNRTELHKAAKNISNYHSDVIIKITKATSGGQGVSMIQKETPVSEIEKIFERFGKNFICQEKVMPSSSTAIFNKSSLNTFRVNTLNINGKASCECLMMRHGLGDNFVDNFAAGGIVCGMTTKGKFNGENYNTNLKKVSTLADGSKYTSQSIPMIHDVVATAIDAHQKFMPLIGHAAWDFAIDNNEKPIMIEVNLMLPGIIMEQLTSCSPIFGERTEEVIDYARNRFNNLSWTEFVGGW